MTPEAAKGLADAGPWAVVILIGALLAIGLARAIVVLWGEHLKADAEDRAQRDRSLDLLAAALDGNKLSAQATGDMAKAWNDRNKADAARRRREDA